MQVDLSQFRDLEPGWDTYDAKPVTDAAIRTGEAVAFVPVPDGGIQIEAHVGGVDVEVAINPDGSWGEFYVSPLGENDG